jgi:hypothetical protein
MTGSTSSSFLVGDLHGEVARRFMLRVLENREWLATEPDLARCRAAALAEARRSS